MGDDTLLDVFVRVAPDPNTDIDAIVRAAVDRTQRLFSTLNVNLPVTPVVSAPVHSGGGGSGGGGGGGARGRGGGGGQGDDLAEEFRRARIQATDLSREMQDLRKLVADVGNEDIERRFRLANAELTKIKDSLREADRSDPLALETTIERLNLIRREIADVRQAGVGISFASGGGTASSAFEADTAREEAAQRERTRDSWKLFLDDQQRIIDENRKQLEQLNSDKARLLAIERQIDEKANTERITSLRKDIIERSAGPVGDLYRNAKIAAEDLNREVSLIARTVGLVKDADLSKQFVIARDKAADLRVEVARANEVADLPRLEEAAKNISAAAAQMRRLGDTATISLKAVSAVREEFDDLVNTERLNNAKAKIEQNLQARRFQALGPDEKAGVIELTRQLRLLEVEFQNVARAGRDSASAVSKLGEQAERMNTLRHGISEVYATADAGARSFNTLSNNAYQLGQAFEDAAVGYSLNGFAGAVRGAANNVAFLLNDLSRVPQFQEIIGKRFAGMLPLVAGVGAALAVTVLPKIVEWLSSLNDIENKIRDISKELSDAFEDLDTEIELKIKGNELRRTLEDASSVQDILKQIRDIDLGNQDKRESLRLLGEGLNATQLFGDEQTPIQKLREHVNNIYDAAEEAIEKRQTGWVRSFRRWSGQEEIYDNIFSFYGESGKTAIENLKKFKDEIFQVKRAVDQVQSDLLAGTLSRDTLVRAQRQNDSLKTDLPGQVDRLDIENKEQLVSDMNAVSDEQTKFLKKVEDALTDLENSTSQVFQIGFDAARKKVSELSAELSLLQSVSLKGNVKFDIDLLNLNTQIAEGREIVRDAVKAIREEAKRANVKIDEGGMLAIEQEFEVRTAVTIQELKNQKLDEQKKIEEKILDLKKKQNDESKFTDFESFAKQLQVNALSTKEDTKESRLKELEKELEEVREDLRRLEKASGRVSDKKDFQDVATERRDGPEQLLKNIRENLRRIENAPGMMGGQDGFQIFMIPRKDVMEGFAESGKSFRDELPLNGRITLESLLPKLDQSVGKHIDRVVREQQILNENVKKNKGVVAQ